MDNQDIRTLKILEEIDNDHVPSQRDLAKKLNVSLGLVNSFIKRLAHKGYFKITTIPKNRARYILTPKGAAEKSRLTYEYIRYSFQFYKASRKKLQKIFKTLEKENVQNIVFYGVSDLTEIAFISLQETSLQLIAVVDDIKI
ncbi:MAG: winged helix-turn-helix transcriptional regulator, partial [Desulfobacterales bacterium]|nr:winged helix-turn-helix transcriptional regulator [Desulfobacterales bacterium]